MKILPPPPLPPVGAEYFQANRRKDMTKLVFAFRPILRTRLTTGYEMHEDQYLCYRIVADVNQNTCPEIQGKFQQLTSLNQPHGTQPLLRSQEYPAFLCNLKVHHHVRNGKLIHCLFT